MLGTNKEKAIAKHCEENDVPIRRIVHEYDPSDRKFHTILYKWEYTGNWFTHSFSEKRYIIDDMAFAESTVVKEVFDLSLAKLDKDLITTNVVELLTDTVVNTLQNGFENDLLSTDSSLAEAKQVLRRSGIRSLNALKKAAAKQATTMPSAVLQQVFSSALEQVKFGRIFGDSIQTPVLPRNCSLYRKKGSREVFVLEYQPMARNVKIAENLATLVGDSGRTYRLMFPWTIFFVEMVEGEFSSLSCFMRNKKLQTNSRKLYKPLIANYWASSDDPVRISKVCTGNINIHSQDTSGKIEEIIAHFWASNFNKDLSKDIVAFMEKDKQIRTFERWEKLSRTDPSFITKLDLVSYDTTLKQALDNYSIDETDRNIEKLKEQILGALIDSSKSIENIFLRKLSDLKLSISDEDIQKSFLEHYTALTENITKQVRSKVESISQVTIQENVWSSIGELLNSQGVVIYEGILNKLNATDSSLYDKARAL